MIEDIKPLVEIVDYSYYIFILLIIAAIAFFTALLFFAFRLKKQNRLKTIVQKLQNLKYSDPKKDAYTITFLARELLVDEQLKQRYEQLQQHLKRYKYKKEVKPFDQEIKKEIALFLELAGARI